MLTLQLRWRIGVSIALVIALGTATNARTESVRYQTQWLRQARVHVVSVDLADPTIKITPAFAHDRIGARQDFSTFLARYHPLAQITGTYFGMRDSLPIGDVVINGQFLFDGYIGTALALKPDNTAQIIDVPYRWRNSWSGYEEVLQGGIRLVELGKPMVYPRSQGFRDPDLFRYATRTAVGLQGPKKLLLVAVNQPILLTNLAHIMIALGCRDAMTLDGGTSTGLAFGRQVILHPGRALTNVLMVVSRPTATTLAKSKPATTPVRARQTPAVPPAPFPSTPPDVTTLIAIKQKAIKHRPCTNPTDYDEDDRAIWLDNPSALVNPRRFRYSTEPASAGMRHAPRASRRQGLLYDLHQLAGTRLF